MRNNWKTKTAGALACSVLALSYVGGCGGDGEGEVGLNGNGGNNNTGSSGDDGGVSGKDADVASDAASDSGGEGDASALPEAVCVIDPEQLTVPIDKWGSHTWDAVQAGDTIHLAYEVPTCTDISNQMQTVEHASFTSTGAFSPAEKIVNGGEGQCFYTRSPTLSVDGTGKAVVYHSATNSGAAELYQKTVGVEGTVRLTSDPDSVRDLEEHIAVTPFGPTDMIAFVNAKSLNGRPVTAMPGQLVTMRPGQPANEVVSGDLLHHIAGVSLAAFPSSNELGGVIAWIADVVDAGATPAVRARLLNKKGEVTGKEQTLTEKIGTFSSVHIAMLPEGADETLAGAVIYGVFVDDIRVEQRFRTIAKDGTFGPERKVTSGNRNAVGGTLTPFAGGYVAAFRQIEGATTKIILSFMDKVGQLAPEGERAFADADTSGSSPKVFVTSDGRFSVVFSNANGDGTFLRVVRGTCDP